jgi:hypothetical protein
MHYFYQIYNGAKRDVRSGDASDVMASVKARYLLSLTCSTTKCFEYAEVINTVLRPPGASIHVCETSVPYIKPYLDYDVSMAPGAPAPSSDELDDHCVKAMAGAMHLMLAGAGIQITPDDIRMCSRHRFKPCAPGALPSFKISFRPFIINHRVLASDMKRLFQVADFRGMDTPPGGKDPWDPAVYRSFGKVGLPFCMKGRNLKNGDTSVPADECPLLPVGVDISDAAFDPLDYVITHVDPSWKIATPLETAR